MDEAVLTATACTLNGVQLPANRHEASLIYTIGRVNQGIRREMRARLAGWNLGVQEYTTLSVLAARPGLSNAQLSRRALVTPQSMIEIMAKLEKRGLVKRGPDPNHGLILRAELTRAGRALLADTDPVIQGIEDEMLASVPTRDQHTALRAMLAAMENLSQDSERRARRDAG